MGWVLSPPNFSACTETIADLTNADLQNPEAIKHARAMPHWLDVVSQSNPAPKLGSDTKSKPSVDSLTIRPNVTCPFWKPLCYLYIYVDNFCGLAQGNKWQRRKVKQILFPSSLQDVSPFGEQ